MPRRVVDRERVDLPARPTPFHLPGVKVQVVDHEAGRWVAVDVSEVDAAPTGGPGGATRGLHVKLEFDVDVDGSQQDALSTLRATLSGVGAATSNEGLATALARCAASDTLTWLADGPPGTVSAWREHRLVTIADLIFEGGMPSEAFVAELFSLTSGEARSLIRRTLARHRRQMSATVRRGLLMAVEQGQVVGRKNARRYYLTMEPAVLGYANDLLSRHPDGLEPIVRREEGINRFEIGIASMTVIVDALGLSLDAVGRGRTRRSS